jgi:hypothetical protein
LRELDREFFEELICELRGYGPIVRVLNIGETG